MCQLERLTVTEWTESRNWTESTETTKRSASKNWTEVHRDPPSEVLWYGEELTAYC